MLTGESRRKTIVITILAVLFLGYIIIDKSGIISKINLPRGDEWYFGLLDTILPLAVAILAFWKRMRKLLAGLAMLLTASFLKFSVFYLNATNTTLYLTLALTFLGSMVIIWKSLDSTLENRNAKLLGIVPVLFGLLSLLAFPIDGLSSMLIAISCAVVAFSSAGVYFFGKGDVLAMAGFLIMATEFAVISSPWISWLSPIFSVVGYFLVGYFIASSHVKGVDSI